MTTVIEQEGGPPRPVLLSMRETLPPGGHDAATRPRCRAELYDEEGARAACHYQSAMTWFGIPFCGNHAPPRRPGMPGWNRLV